LVEYPFFCMLSAGGLLRGVQFLGSIKTVFLKQKYFLVLAYEGTQYHGWQRQAVVSSVQQTIEEAISRIFKETIRIHGCGRTDAGVHATRYYAQVFLPTWDFDLIERLNLVLPTDISIFEILPVTTQANVQYSATSRTYQYFFHLHKNPLLHHFSTWYWKTVPDLDLLRAGLELVMGTKDFYAFCIRPDQYKDTRCVVTKAMLREGDVPGSYIIELQANRFLQQMIRLMVGRLIDLSIGKITLADFRAALEERRAFVHHLPAPPQGLRLAEVGYGEDLWI